MPSDVPQNEEEAAYISFALLETLIELLVKKNIISPDDVRTAILNAIQIIEATPKNSNRRMTDFIRNLSFGQKGFEQA